MRNKKRNIIEIILVIIIVLVCSISLLQSETILGYRSYKVTTDNEITERNDYILVKEIDINNFNKEDIIVYKYKSENNKVITSKIKEIETKDNITTISLEDTNDTIYEEQIYGKYQYKFKILGVLFDIIGNKIVFAICALIPFLTLLLLEVLNIFKENKRKELENNVKEQLELLNKIEKESETKEKLEKRVELKLEEIQEAKKDYKKIKELEQTIQIPLLEIQKEIEQLDKDEKQLEDTIIINTNDIKEEIKKELSTKTVDKNNKKEKKSTKTVEKSDEKVEISTESVEKSVKKAKKSTKSVEKVEKSEDKQAEVVEK